MEKNKGKRIKECVIFGWDTFFRREEKWKDFSFNELISNWKMRYFK